MNKTYTNITPERMVAFRAQAAAQGLSLSGFNSGTAVTHGVTLSYSYDGISNLALVIEDKPWYLPASTIWGELDGFVNPPAA